MPPTRFAPPNSLLSHKLQVAGIFASALLACSMAGCGVGSLPGGSPVDAVRTQGGGHVQGGQQPVSGARVYLYAVSAASAGGSATSLLSGPGYTVTDGGGNFSLTGNYTCPANSYVYALALGGNPGLGAGTSNARLALAAGLGACSALTPSTFLTVNEVTTVATAYSLAAFATSETQIGSASSATVTAAFANIANLVNQASGLSRTVTPDGTGTVPQAKIDSLADALAACVNSDGTGTPCTSLMTAANVASGSGTPVDTFQAVLNVAHAPTINVQAIYNQSAANAPFQPTLSAAPADWTIAVQYGGASGVSLSPASATVAQSGQQVFAASISNAPGGAISYGWSTTAHAGTLTGTAAGQTAFCSTAGQVTYVPNATPALTADTPDSVAVTAYSGTGCAAANAVGSATAQITVTLPASLTTVPGIPTKSYTATVVLPSGSNLRLDSLQVQDSLARTTPAASGTFTIPAYDNGAQIVFISAPDGTPMMMGWMDANHATVSASTTAEVLAYYALGGASMLTEADRQNTIVQIPQLPGFTLFANTVAAEVAANPDAFAQRDTTVAGALNTFVATTTGVTPQPNKVGGTLHPNDITINPDVVTPQSGVSLSSTAPPPPYFTNNAVTPFSTYLKNAYRRRTHAFVIKQKSTLNGSDTPSGAQVTDFDVAPTAGLNGGVTGALTDIIKAYFGNQPTAYAPVTSDPFDLPVDSGFDSTTYQVINVGPGASGKPRAVQLTSAQNTILYTTAVNSFVSDVMVPFINNVVLGTGEDADAANNTALSGNSRSAFVLALESNLAAVVNALPGEQDKLVGGDYKGAAADLLFNAATFPAVGNAITSALKSAVGGAGLNTTEFQAGLDKWNRIMYGAGAGLQLFDSVVYVSQLANSNTVDVWTVKSTAFHATLSPATSTLNGIGNTTLTAAVLNVDSTAGLSYQWTLIPAAGQQPIGTLSSSGNTVPDAGGKLTFCSSSQYASYANNASSVSNLTGAAADTVSVRAFSKASCAAGSQLSDTATATVTTNPNGTLSVTPSAPVINPGDAVTLAASYSDPKSATPVVPGSYSWVLQAGTYPGPNGTIAGGGQGPDSGSRYGICTTTPSLTYTSTATFPLSADDVDAVQVRAYTSADCSGNNYPPSTGASVAVASITTSGSPRLRVNSTSTLKPGEQVSLSAAFRLGLANTPTPGSYLWTTTGTYGSLTEVGGQGRTGQTSYCSTSATAAYVAAANNGLSGPVGDTVTATPYSDAQCTTGKADGLTGNATMNIDPPAGPFVTPGAIRSLVQSGDGNFYASANGACGVNQQGFCDYILRIAPQGAVTTLHTFEIDGNDSTNSDGSGVNGIIEGRDGALYGTAKNAGPYGTGTIFKVAKDGTFTLLHAYPTQSYVTGGYGTSYHCGNYYVFTATAYSTGAYPGPLTEGADGNLYGLQHYGTFAGGNQEGALFRVSSGGGFSLVRNFVPVISRLSGGSGPGNCGATIVSTPNDPVYVSSSFALDPPALLQALDGNFYAELTGRDTGVALDTLARLQGTSAAAAHTLPQDGSQGSGTLSPLIAAPNGGIFSNTTLGNYSYLNGNFQVLNSTPTPIAVLGSDGNFYGVASSSAGTYFGNLTQTTPLGASSVFASIQSGDSTANVQTGYGSGPVLEAANGNLVGGAIGYDGGKPAAQATTYFLFNVPTSGQLNGAIHLSFSSPTAQVNRAIQLNWTVANAFSLTAQQCHATVQQPAQGSAAGAGNWSGAQYGALNGSVYSGSAAIVPTAAGTYTYALTCGGKESGFATLSVQ